MAAARLQVDLARMGGNRRVIGIHVLVQTALPAIGFAIATLGPALLWRNRRGMRAG